MEISRGRKSVSVNYITDGIEYTVKNFGKRPPCSDGEREAGNYFKEEMEKFMDKVEVLPFKCFPDAFMGGITVAAACFLLGFVLYFFAPIASIMLCAFGIYCALTQFVLYKQSADSFFEEKESQNVYAVKKPSGEVKRRVVLCGHVDAAYEWNWLYRLGFVGCYGILGGSVLGSAYLLAISIAKIACGQLGGLPYVDGLLWAGIVGLIFLPLYIACFFFIDKKHVVDGANDNLCGCYMSMAVPKMLDEESIKLENTELCVLLTGCEEAGLRGARAFAKEKKEELSDVETTILCLDSIHDAGFLSANKSEILKSSKNDLATAEFFAECARKRGIPVKLSDVVTGTDSSAFSDAGLKSTCITALDAAKIGKYYHTRQDSYDNLNPELIGDVFEIVLDCIEKMDKDANGAPANEEAEQ